MKALKISEGDLVVIELGECNDENTNKVHLLVDSWCKARGLTQVQVIVFSTSSPPSKFEITVVSVNDVFDNQVLNGRK
jgi:hypothetical protein